MNQNILSVAQVNAYIKKLFEMDYIVKSVWIQGEVSNCKQHSSGHVYFTLKDANSSIACVLFKGYRLNSLKDLKDGMKIIAHGAVSVYEKSGQYQLYVKEFLEDGVGLLYMKFEALKERLDELGWFSEEYKKALPYYPRKVGIVTSDTGAAIQDIVHISKRRNPFIQLVLYPSLVQGAEAKDNIVEGIRFLDAVPDIDIIIIGRGGGSIEDLWPFNEECVAKAIFEAKTPIISAVGHETDFTISDFVADMRAPTPSAAAELAIPSIDEIQSSLNYYKEKLTQLIEYRIDQKRSLIEVYKARFERYNPRHSVEQIMQNLNDLQDRLENAIFTNIKDLKNQLALLSESLKRVSPIEKLKDGFAYITDENGKHIKSIDHLNGQETLVIQLFDGQIKAGITNIEKGEGNYGEE
ncbi:MAG: exodeoxyribonuclease VII large subunit [Firmicutes bacterium HGW-Firmicutes-1]|jgi:exodeoxyribonuclease VII large subunit|nr:MAG: exodeoxyribonuclease VII large subunit [Firmicutes bacterium HGW-Firmicutes-1]